jgi:hypothetical protein
MSVAERSKARVCCRLIAGIVGSNLAEGMDVQCLVCVVCRVGSIFYEEMITHSEESSVCMCVRARARARFFPYEL